MTEPHQRAGIRDVARASGYSLTTVSHALSGARAVNPATRARIQEVAQELGYRPDPRARGLALNRSGLIGFVGDVVLTTPFAGELVQGAQEVLQERGLMLLAMDTGADREQEDRTIRLLLHHRVEGIIYARMYHQEVELPDLVGAVPVVVANASPTRTGTSIPSVVPDEAAIGRLAARHLLEHRHRRIAFAQTTDTTPASAGREAGYREELTAAGIEAEEALVVRSSSDAAGGRASGLRLLDLPEPPTAVFCFNDQIAMGVMQAAQRRGLEVPRDLSILGVDDLRNVADALDPGLTTIALPHAEMGRWAAEQMSILVGGELAGRPADSEVLQCRLVERQSVSRVAR